MKLFIFTTDKFFQMIRKLLLSVLLFYGLQSQAQFFEGFEGTTYPDLATGQWNLNSGFWNVSDNGFGLAHSWTANTAVTAPPLVYNGAAAAYIDRENIGGGNTSEDWLVSPGIAITAESTLDFFSRTTIIGDQGTLYQVRVSTTSQDDHSSFTTIDGWNETDLGPSYNIYQQKIIPLGQFAGQTIYIAFVKSYFQPTASLSGDRWLIDNVSVSPSATTFNNVHGTVSYGTTLAECNPLNPIGGVAVGVANSTYGFNTNSGYYFNTLENNFTVSANINSPYFTINPPSYVFNYPVTGNAATANFCVTPDGIHHDLEISVMEAIPISAGFHAGYWVVYRNAGTQVESGSIDFSYDDNVLDFLSISQQSSGSGWTTTFNENYDFTDLAPLEQRQFYINYDVNSETDTPPVNVGDNVTFTATITSTAGGEETPINNSFTDNGTAVAAVDPNDIRVMEGTAISLAEADDYLHYIIRFQNVGTASATNIVVRDLIEADLDLSTIQVLSGSHSFTTNVENNIVEFKFNNINLPQEAADEPNSHGFVAFKIKPKNTVGVGSVITNNANIYFDYNYPITTNTVTTTVTALGTNEFNIENSFSLYPNPANASIAIGLKDGITVKDISIYNTLGQLVKAVDAVENTSFSVDISDLNSGIYLIQIVSDKGKATKKFVKL